MNVKKTGSKKKKTDEEIERQKDIFFEKKAEMANTFLEKNGFPKAILDAKKKG